MKVPCLQVGIVPDKFNYVTIEVQFNNLRSEIDNTIAP
jgi:hypothetical protein